MTIYGDTTLAKRYRMRSKITPFFYIAGSTDLFSIIIEEYRHMKLRSSSRCQMVLFLKGREENNYLSVNT